MLSPYFARSTSQVPSEEPSSTTTTSKSVKVWASTLSMAPCTLTARLYVGIIADILGVMKSLKGPDHSVKHVMRMKVGLSLQNPNSGRRLPQRRDAALDETTLPPQTQLLKYTRATEIKA